MLAGLKSLYTAKLRLRMDEGSGISDEELPHIFERFYRGKTARHSGFGIGMAMAQSIFAKQNGTIKAQNREEGGAKFVIHVRK